MSNKNKNIISYFSILAFAMIVGLFIFSKENDNNDDSFQEEFNNNYRVYSLNIPDNLNFAGETVPMEDSEVVERLDMELLRNTYWQSNGLILIKRANKFFPIIEPILAQYGIPDDFKYLAVAESSLNPIAISRSKAVGLWQFMKATGKSYGLEITKNIDERYNIELETIAACKYLLKSKERFGTWTLAAASYNAGIAGISKQQDRQLQSNYYDLLLNQETSRYVFRIIALKEILSNPKKYGFHLREKDLYSMKDLKTITVNYSIENIAQWAISQNTNYKTVKYYNPWLREIDLKNPLNKTYKIQLPN